MLSLNSLTAWIILLRKSERKISLYFCEMTLWQLKREAFGFNSSTEFTIEKHKSYFPTLSMFIVALELPKKQHHGTILKFVSLHRTYVTEISYFIL